MKTIFEKSSAGRLGVSLEELDVKQKKVIPDRFLRDSLDLPELSELDIVRHYTALSKLNYSIDCQFYPLGSCTMKYNPKVNEDVAKLPGFTHIHPYQDEKQGCLKLMFELEKMLCEITGMSRFSLQPAAGAQGELTGLMIIRAYFADKSEGRKKILVPDSAHGTNPASVTLCGFEAVQITSDDTGCIDIEDLKQKMSKDVAGLMLTNPNTLGLFEKNILDITRIVHDAGGLVYCDGANMNAMLGIAKPTDMGCDIIHLNLHKTFSTPHGGGGPGSGPLGVVDKLVKFLPMPVVEWNSEEKNYSLNYALEKSIGKITTFYGNFGVMVKAYSYIKSLGTSLKDVARNAVLNANYLKAKLKGHYNVPYDDVCMHEFVLNDEGLPNEVTTNDIAKRLLDYGHHPPTVYFPLNVKGAIMIEPTETENKDTLDSFAEALIKIKQEAKEDPDQVKTAPHTTPVKKLDEVKAAREPKLKWEKKK